MIQIYKLIPTIHALETLCLARPLIDGEIDGLTRRIDIPVTLDDLDEDALDLGELVRFEEMEATLALAEWEQDLVDMGYYEPEEEIDEDFV